MRYEFADCELDLDRIEVRRGGSVVPVEPQVFDVLRYLAEHAERVVSKEELLDHVWGDRFVSPSALTSRIKSARQAVGDDGQRQGVIRTVHGRGYQLAAEVRAVADSRDHGASPIRRRVVPRPPTRLVGRDEDVEALVELVVAARIVTVCGPGGVGKTRLALEVAAELERRGVLVVDVVELGDLSADADVVPAIAASLGVGERSDLPLLAAVIETLATEQRVVVLDNCEHVSARVSTVVDGLVRLTDGVCVLATSRAPLQLNGEHLWRLGPLPLESADGRAPAVQLFTERIHAQLPQLVLGDDEIEVVEGICHRLDGMPLLIELAAARTRHLGLRAVLAALDDPTAFDVGAAVPVRQRSVESLVDWSLSRLEVAHADLFVRLSVFAGWFEQAAVAAVGGSRNVARELSTLVDESLIVVDVTGDVPRWRLLLPLRDYGRRVLETQGLRDEVETLHARHIAHEVATADHRLRGCEAPAAMSALSGLVPETRVAATTFMKEGNRAGLAELVGGLHWLAQDQMRADIFAIAREAVQWERDTGSPGSSSVLALAAVAAWQRGDLDDADALAAAAVTLPAGRRSATAHLVVGQVDQLRGDYAAADKAAVNALRFARAADDPLVTVVALVMRALVNGHSGNAQSARQFALEALDVAHHSGSALCAGWAEYAAGEIVLESDPAAAAAHLDRATRLAERVGSPLLRGIASLSSTTSWARRCAGVNRETVESDVRFLLGHWQRAGMWAHQWATIRNLVVLLSQWGDHVAAAELYGAVLGPGQAFPARGAERARLDAAMDRTTRALRAARLPARSRARLPAHRCCSNRTSARIAQSAGAALAVEQPILPRLGGSPRTSPSYRTRRAIPG